MDELWEDILVVVGLGGGEGWGLLLVNFGLLW